MSSDAAGQDTFAQFGPVEVEQLSRIQKMDALAAQIVQASASVAS